MKYLTLATLLACNSYPSDANLKVEANNFGYSVYGESDGESFQLGAINNPKWLHDPEQGVRIKVGLRLGYSYFSQSLYDGNYLDKKGTRIAPDLETLLEQEGIIGADCGFHHPDSHDPCYAGVKVSEHVVLFYRVSSSLKEKDYNDNTIEVTLSFDDLQSHANALSSKWLIQEQREVEEELKELAEKSQGWK